MFRAFTSALLALALAVGAAAQQRVTINVNCPQGIVEGKHTFSVEVTDTSQSPPTNHTVTVSVREFSDSAAIAGALAAKLNSLFPNLCVKVKIEEVDRPSGNKPGSGEPSAEDKIKRHDLILPACLKFVKGAHTRNGRPTNTGQVTIEPAAERKTSSAVPTRLELDLPVSDPGTVLEIGVFARTVPPDLSTAEFAIEPGAHPLQVVGDWLSANYGATVTYPSDTAMVATIPASTDVSFCYASAGETYTPDSPEQFADALAFSVLYE